MTRIRQAAVVVGLVMLLAIAAVFLPPFHSGLAAARGAGGGMVGPSAPPRVDSAGAGGPTNDGRTVTLNYSGGQVTMTSPWDCGSPLAYRTFIPGGGSPYTSVSRTLPSGLMQTVAASNVVSGRVYGMVYSENYVMTVPTVAPRAGPLLPSGAAQLIDSNGDGAYDTLQVSGQKPGAAGVGVVSGTVNAMIPLVYGSMSGGVPDHVSIAWSQASVLGVNFSDGCSVAGAGGTDPQVWIPLTDTNSDGRPDSVVLDLNGNGVADPEFLQSPPVAGAALPAIGAPGLVLLAAGIGMLGLFALRRRPAPAQPAI